MNVFDIIGPVMIGPSSSHTAGAARIGFLARLLLGEEPKEAIITLHGSFAHTYKGHGTDVALVGGILNFKPNDERIKYSLLLAKNSDLECTFKTEDIPEAHPNTAIIELTSFSGKKISMQGSSIGGGNIEITKLNGKDVIITGQNPSIIVEYKDIPGRISEISSVMARHKMNISQLHISRDKRGGTAVVTIQVDGENIKYAIKEDIEKIEYVYNVILVPIIA
ncbi:MAG: L-serine ammonia-lyase, iron-sulfur-dependent subunit beta [Treponema sp.]